MTIEITYKNTNRFVMLAGNLDHPEEMNEVLDFMDPLGVSVVESGDVTIESHGDTAEVTITLLLERASIAKTATKQRKTAKRKPRKTRKGARAKGSEAPAAYSEPSEEPEADAASNSETAQEAAKRFARAQAAAATAKAENPEPPEDDGVDPLGDLEEALGGEADSQPF